MVAWLFLFSVGQHLFMPLIQSITMEFAAEGQAGRRLGQVTGASNLAGIGGSLLILVGFRSLGFGFATAFLIAAGGLLLAALLIRTMKADPPPATRTRFVMRREYKLYYWLSILYGTRKQIFLTFSPWCWSRFSSSPRRRWPRCCLRAASSELCSTRCSAAPSIVWASVSFSWARPSC